jgi:hypothetical protein
VLRRGRAADGRRRWRRGAIAIALVPVLAALVFLGTRLLASGSSSQPTRSRTVPIAVLNATSTPGAAHTIATTLEANHLHVRRVGDIKNASLAHGAYVLYPPGAKRQAQEVARLIPSLSPTVTAIQPQLQNTVGQHDEIVVVLD